MLYYKYIINKYIIIKIKQFKILKVTYKFLYFFYKIKKFFKIKFDLG